MSNYDKHPALSGPGMMFISAAIFGYFGFYLGLLHTNQAGQFVLFYALLDWTLKGTAIGFVVSGVLTFGIPLVGNLLYGLTGVLSTILFITVAAMDFLDNQNPPAAIPWFLLLLFAAWNGYGSWQGLKIALALQKLKSRNMNMLDMPGPEEEIH